jgi:hypothetical protein
MTRGFLRKGSRMRSADDHGNAATTELARETVRMQSGRRWSRNPNDVRRHIKPHRFNDLIGVRHGVFARRQSSDQRHG